MTANIDAMKALLASMRQQFLHELPERCDHFNTLILQLENAPDDRETFNELYRGIHSLKGSGGTHGLHIITTLCHQLENFLTESNDQHDFGEAFATRALAYVDLLRRVEAHSHGNTPDYSAIEADLETLRQSALHSRKTGLIAESSPMMATFYQQALKSLPLQLTLVDSGLTALERLLREPFDFVIVSRVIKDLNGIALIAALRDSQTRNHNIPAMLVTSTRDGIPEHARFNAIITRDQQLADNLITAVQAALPK